MKKTARFDLRDFGSGLNAYFSNAGAQLNRCAKYWHYGSMKEMALEVDKIFHEDMEMIVGGVVHARQGGLARPVRIVCYMRSQRGVGPYRLILESQVFSAEQCFEGQLGHRELAKLLRELPAQIAARRLELADLPPQELAEHFVL